MRLILIYYLIYITVYYSKADDDADESKFPEYKPSIDQSTRMPEIQDSPGSDVVNVIEKIELIAASAEKSRREGILPEEHSEDLYYEMVETLADLIEILKDPQNTYKFWKVKGVDRIVTPIIGIDYDPLKKQFLILIKALFQVAPTTAEELMPVSIVDKLLDIFEHDNDLALKAHALEIMCIWLPNNPKLQARVMRLKGLEPFYNQVSKLDNSVIETLLDLFNKILKEHVDARSNVSQKTKDDFDKMKLYEMIGLIERMSTPRVCNGLLNIIEGVSSFNLDVNFSSSIFELIQNIKPFCLKMYVGKAQAIRVFDALADHVAKINETFKNMNTDIRILLDDYVKNIKVSVRDEF